jgi:hypothetical protein
MEGTIFLFSSRFNLNSDKLMRAFFYDASFVGGIWFERDCIFSIDMRE